MMNPMYQKIAFSFIRYGLAAFGFEGLLSDDLLTQGIGALLTLVTIAWSIRKNVKEQQTLVTALKEADISQSDATAKVNDPSTLTPSVTTPKDTVPV